MAVLTAGGSATTTSAITHRVRWPLTVFLFIFAFLLVARLETIPRIMTAKRVVRGTHRDTRTDWNREEPQSLRPLSADEAPPPATTFDSPTRSERDGKHRTLLTPRGGGGGLAFPVDWTLPRSSVVVPFSRHPRTRRTVVWFPADWRERLLAKPNHSALGSDYMPQWEVGSACSSDLTWCDVIRVQLKQPIPDSVCEAYDVFNPTPCVASRESAAASDGIQEAFCKCSEQHPLLVNDVVLHIRPPREVGFHPIAPIAALVQVVLDSVAEEKRSGTTGALPPDFVVGKNKSVSFSSSSWVQLTRATTESHASRCLRFDEWVVSTVAVVDAVRAELLRLRLDTADLLPTSSLPPIDHPVYYGFSSTLFMPGHGLEGLLISLGQYLHYEPYWRQSNTVTILPWLLPVRHGATNLTIRSGQRNASRLVFSSAEVMEAVTDASRMPVWSQFLLQFAQVLAIPVVPLVMDQTYWMPNVVFSQFEGGDGMCWRRIALRRLYPHAVAQNQRAFPRHAGETIRRVAIMKLHDPAADTAVGHGAAQHTPRRAFIQSAVFGEKLVRHRFTIAHPSVSLLQRMYLVNEAEVIVTTYGATASTLVHSLLDYRDAAPTNRTRTIVILVHYGYALETAKIFGVLPTVPWLKKRKRFETYMRYNFSTQTKHIGWDYDGGPRLCARWLLVYSLNFVRDSDLLPCPFV